MNDKITKNSEIREFGHDVLNSLTRIIGQMEICLKNEDINVIKAKLTLSLQAANDCSAFVKEHMNATSHIKDKTLAIQFFKDLSESYKKMYPDFHLLIDASASPDLEIEVNRAFLRNAVQNLTKNSMEAGAKEMVIVISPTRICFIDNGPGISPEKAKVIKEKGTTKTDSKGHGLGLLSLTRFCKSNGWRLLFHNSETTQYFPTGFTVEFILKS